MGTTYRFSNCFEKLVAQPAVVFNRLDEGNKGRCDENYLAKHS